MADTSFSDRSGSTAGTTIVSAWLNVVNKLVFWGRRPNYATTTGSANAQVLTLESGSLYTAGSEADGDEFLLKAGFTNTSTMTLQVKPSGGTNTAVAVQFDGVALSGGEVQSGVVYRVTRLGSTWQITRSKQLLFAGQTAQRTLTLPDANLTLPNITTKGDTIAASGAGVLVRIPIGTDGLAYLADSTQTGGVNWLSALTGLAMVCNGRLTLTTGSAVPTGNQTAATTVFFTPFRGNRIATFDGAKWNVSTLTEKSVAVPATTTTPFDVFIVDGTLALETVNWTNDTTRATALVLQDGVLVKSGATTRRYLGTLRTTGASGQTEDSTTNRFVWNYYNRVLRNTQTSFSADRSTTSGSYTELNTEIRSNFVLGVSEDSVFGCVNGSADNASAGGNYPFGIGFDSTTTVDTGFENNIFANATAGAQDAAVSLSSVRFGLAVGFHFATLLAKSPNGANTVTFRGTSGSSTVKTYLQLGVWG